MESMDLPAKIMKQILQFTVGNIFEFTKFYECTHVFDTSELPVNNDLTKLEDCYTVYTAEFDYFGEFCILQYLNYLPRQFTVFTIKHVGYEPGLYLSTSAKPKIV